MLVLLTFCLGSPDDLAQPMQQGYESRHVVSTIWINSILSLIDSEDNCSKAALNATLACSFNTLAVTEVSPT